MELQKFTKKDILTKVRKDDKGRLSLNDLYDLTEKKKNTDPRTWLRHDNVQDIISAVSGILNVSLNHIIKSKRGKGGGTYAHRNIFLAYAKYLDAELHVICNEIVFERIEEENNPDIIVDRAIKTYERRGKDAQWIAKRLHAKGVRNQFTQTLSQHGVLNDGYKKCTDAIYIGLFGQEAKLIRRNRNLPDGCNLRENLSSLELSAISLSEELAMEDISKNRLYGNEECSISSNRASRSVSQSIINFRKN